MIPSPTPIPVHVVNVDRDAVDVLMAALTIISVVLAVAAFLTAMRAASKSGREVAAERRRQFELEILRELATAAEDSLNGEPFDNRVNASLGMLPASALVVWRQMRDAGRSPEREMAELRPLIDSLGVPGDMDWPKRRRLALRIDVQREIKARVDA